MERPAAGELGKQAFPGRAAGFPWERAIGNRGRRVSPPPHPAGGEGKAPRGKGSTCSPAGRRGRTRAPRVAPQGLIEEEDSPAVRPTSPACWNCEALSQLHGLNAQNSSSGIPELRYSLLRLSPEKDASSSCCDLQTLGFLPVRSS